MPPNNTFTKETTGSRGVMAPTATSISDNELIKEIEDSAEKFYFQQAEIAIENGAAYGGFIILTAALHHFAGLNKGVGSIDGNEIRDYCRIYLKTYDENALWKSLRCGFFHRGAPQKSGTKTVLLTSKNQQNHDPRGTKVINRGYITGVS